MNEIESKYSDHPLRGWFIKQSIVFPLRTILVSLIFTIVAASGVRFFMIDDDMMKILPKELDSRISWDIIQEEFGSTEVIFIAFGKKDESIFNQDALASLWDVGEQLEATNEVEEITSISTITRMDNLDGFMEVDDLQPYRDVTLDEVEDIRLYLEKNPTIKKRFVSEDDEYFMMMVQPYTSDGLNYFRDKVVSIADPILSNYDIYYGGQAYVTGTMPAMIRDDVIILARIGILIMVTILLINLRSIAAVGMVIMVIGLSLFAMIGSMGWIYYLTGSDRFLFTLANTSMPIILLTIANSDGVHVVSKFFKELRIKKDTKSDLFKK